MAARSAPVACVVACGALLAACTTGPSPIPSWAAMYAASEDAAAGPLVLPTPPPPDGGVTDMDTAAPPASKDSGMAATVDSAPADDASMVDGGDAGGDAAMPPLDASKVSETWTQFYTTYLAAGTPGNCGSTSASCHVTQTGTPSDTFSYIEKMGGAGAGLTPQNFGMEFTWNGGPMPLTGGPTTLPAAVTALNAWIAAGAQNN